MLILVGNYRFIILYLQETGQTRTFAFRSLNFWFCHHWEKKNFKKNNNKSEKEKWVIITWEVNWCGFRYKYIMKLGNWYIWSQTFVHLPYLVRTFQISHRWSYPLHSLSNWSLSMDPSNKAECVECIFFKGWIAYLA